MPYPDWVAEFPGIEMLHDLPISAIGKSEEKDDDEEAATAEQNCALRELPQKIENKKQDGDYYLEGDPDEQEMIDMVKEHMQHPRPEQLIVLENEDAGQDNVENEINDQGIKIVGGKVQITIKRTRLQECGLLDCSHSCCRPFIQIKFVKETKLLLKEQAI